MSLLDALFLDAYRDPKDVWIALRTDAAKGSGTQSDPFNGSSIPYPSISIATLTSEIQNGVTVATATTGLPHGFADKELVTISGVYIQADNMQSSGDLAKLNDCHYVGTFEITWLSAYSFTYEMINPPYSATASPLPGGIQCWREREQFDVVMRTVGQNSLIHIGVGVFETKGYHPNVSGGWNPQSGQRILGSGMGLTTLKLVGASASHKGAETVAIGFSYDDAGPDGFEVCDLTVDCNADGQPNPLVSCAAVRIPKGGHHIRILRVRVIHFGSLGPLGNPKYAYRENFPIFASGKVSGDNLVDAVIEDCVAEYPSPNAAWNSTIFQMSGDSNDYKTIYSRGTILRNNYANGQIGYGPLAYVDHITPGTEDSYHSVPVTLTTKTPHGYTFPGNISVAGVRVNGNLANAFNGVFKIEQDGLTASTIKYKTYNAAASPGTPDAPDMNTIIGAPVSPQPVPVDSMFLPYADAPDLQTFRVTTSIPHNLTVNNRSCIENVTLSGLDAQSPYGPKSLDPFEFANNPCNGTFRVTAVWSKTQFDYIANFPIDDTKIIPTDDGYYHFSGGVLHAQSHQCMGADNGTGAVVEGNRLLHVFRGGPYHDTGTTLDLVARNNYYHDIASGPQQSCGLFKGKFATPPPPPPPLKPLTHDGVIATCNVDGGHGLVVGQVVYISLALVNGNPVNPYNGYQFVTSKTSTSFNYIMTSDPGADADASPTPLFQEVTEVTHWTLENNILELTLGPLDGYWSQPTAIFMGVGADYSAIPYAFRRALIRGNLIRQMDWKTDGYHTGITVRNSEKLLAENNVIDVGEPHPVRFTKSVSPSFFNNSTPAGTLLPGFDEVSLETRGELQTTIEDIAMLCL